MSLATQKNSLPSGLQYEPREPEFEGRGEIAPAIVAAIRRLGMPSINLGAIPAPVAFPSPGSAEPNGILRRIERAVAVHDVPADRREQSQ